MKKIILIMAIVCWACVVSASEISDDFADKYQSLRPRESSSVGSDYLFEQIALGSEYTVRLLDQVNEHQSSIADKTVTIAEKLDMLIQQNQRIIELLEKQNTQGQ